MKILKYDIIRYERTDVMNYKINMKCELKNVSETLKDKQEELKKYYLELNTMYLKQKEKVAYYYEDINTGSILSYNSDILFYAASSIKILVCVMLLEMAENKKISLEDTLLVTMNDLKQDTGIIKFQKQDTYYTIKDLIRLTITESDNTAYIKLVNYVGKENLEKYGKSLGALHTMEGKDLFGLINCDDMAIYWKKVRDFINKSKYGQDFYNWLSNPSFSIVLPESIENNNFVKKYGSWDIAYHEAGYVDAENPYYMIILTQKFKCDDKEEFVNNTAKELHRIHKFINNK